MRTNIKTSAIAVTIGVLGAWAVPALAAPPANDTFPNATPVTVGFSEQLDTTEATTDADDAQLNASCGAPATDASVWYVLEGSDQLIKVDTTGTDYFAGVAVGVGTQGNLVLVACGPDAVAFFAEVGTTYYVMAFDDQFDGGGNGGTLNISFTVAPPAPTLTMTVDPVGKVNNKTGVATISGTYTCTDADSLEAFIDIRQNVGRFAVLGSGSFSESAICDGEAHPWSATIEPFNGKFAGGKAATITVALACGDFQCTDGYVEQTVMLRGGR